MRVMDLEKMWWQQRKNSEHLFTARDQYGASRGLQSVQISVQQPLGYCPAKPVKMSSYLPVLLLLYSVRPLYVSGDSAAAQ